MALNLGAIAQYLNSNRRPVEGDGLNMAMMQRQLMRPAPPAGGSWGPPAAGSGEMPPSWGPPMAGSGGTTVVAPPAKGPTYTAVRRQDAVNPDLDIPGYRHGPVPTPAPTIVPNAGYFNTPAALPPNPGPPDPSFIPVEPEPIVGDRGLPEHSTPWWTNSGYSWMPTNGLPITGYGYGPPGDTHTVVPDWRGAGTHPELGQVSGIPVAFGPGTNTAGAMGGGYNGGAGVGGLASAAASSGGGDMAAWIRSVLERRA